MSYPVYGRYAVAEPFSALTAIHRHRGEPLKEVDHEPKNGVLDQSDLHAQGILCSTFIPGAGDPDALGSCTCNADTSALSNELPEAEYLQITGAQSYDDTVALEKFAISTYHGVTAQTGDTTQEWPPTDCGSTGAYVYQYDHAKGWTGSQAIAHGGQDIVSLLQRNGILQGTPFFNSWEEPNAQGFVDGDGTAEALQAAINSGVAGGHETYICAIEKLSLTGTGRVIPGSTLLRVRNSWSKSWGDNGDFRIHLSTLVMLGSYADFRQIRR